MRRRARTTSPRSSLLKFPTVAWRGEENRAPSVAPTYADLSYRSFDELFFRKNSTRIFIYLSPATEPRREPCDLSGPRAQSGEVETVRRCDFIYAFVYKPQRRARSSLDLPVSSSRTKGYTGSSGARARERGDTRRAKKTSGRGRKREEGGSTRRITLWSREWEREGETSGLAHLSARDEGNRASSDLKRL